MDRGWTGSLEFPTLTPIRAGDFQVFQVRVGERRILSESINMATLLVVEGPSEGLKFALAQHNLVMVGRDHGATLQILDGRISRFHVQIKRVDDGAGHKAKDFDSANGVFINDERITDERPLADGDLIRIGDSGILYTSVDEPDAQRVTQLMRQYGQARYRTQLDTAHSDPD